eukprot:TRINITY_DN8082_c0_g1_i1.p1 TRINITY_DN8082_c0_g1~~TRINITY_DN8082_c0_g1_i1.p1  ORF type:complete len:570 (+),score=119.58 TRINITY_DN8082_c0_g1_i1:29-1711(+)
MRGTLISIVLLLVLWPQQAVADANGGSDCAVCTLVLGLVEQSAYLHNQSFSHALSEFCLLFPSSVQGPCKTFVDKYGPEIIDLFDQKETPDVVCNAIGLCKRETATCRLFPPPSKELLGATYDEHVAAISQKVAFKAPPKWLCQIAPAICDIINRVSNHKPAIDFDNDLFGTEQTLRGTNWRGKDCNDFNGNIHPGRQPLSEDKVEDGNCNGIAGIDLVGKSYEKLWCDNTSAMGVAIAGDSAAAHFRIPPDWLNATALSNKTFAHLLGAVEDELDWPMLSGSTGYMNSSRFAPDVYGPMDSLYRHFFELNRCNHRDYQNVGVNGAAAESMFKEILPTLARNRLTDKPLFLEVALIGNDVCGHEHDFDHMTTPQEFYHWMNQTFYWLEAHLPFGSHVISVGLVDGRILYDSMHARIHPIGWTRQDVNYAQVYDFLNCLDISPCWGWMNGNETVRNLTTERAQSLTSTLGQLVKDVTPVFKNIKITFMGDFTSTALKQWELQGGQPWEMIEPTDGFHPSQLANYWIAQYLVQNLTKQGLMPPPNPHNDDIYRKFGDQGGYD